VTLIVNKKIFFSPFFADKKLGGCALMIFSFFVSLLGFVFASRISQHLIDQKFLSRSEMTKIGTACFCVMIFALFIFTRARFALWCAIFLPQLMFAIAIFSLVKRRSRAFREHFREQLTVIHLKMKSGRSFRQALDEVINESDLRYREKLAEIRSVVVFSQQKPMSRDSFVFEVIDEFNRIDRNPHAAIRRLAVFREKLRIEDDFRRKSGQVLAQIRAQSLIMCGLYLAVAIFVGLRFGWRANIKLMSVSLLLFICGLVWIWLSGRRMKWKV
jgi:hypothetical protein